MRASLNHRRQSLQPLPLFEIQREPAAVFTSGDDRVRELARKFSTHAASSVETRRLPNIAGTLLKRNKDETNNTTLTNTQVSPIKNDGTTNSRRSSDDAISPLSPEAHLPLSRKSSLGKTFGEGGYGDKFTPHWDWPLFGDAHVKTTKDNFEATFGYHPFGADEIEARVLCTDLMIRCSRDLSKEAVLLPSGRRVREVSRTYRLPLNVDPRTVKFVINEQQRQLRVMADKILPLALAVSSYFELKDLQAVKKGVPMEEVMRLKHLRDAGCPQEELDKYIEELVARLSERDQSSEADEDRLSQVFVDTMSSIGDSSFSDASSLNSPSSCCGSA